MNATARPPEDEIAAEIPPHDLAAERAALGACLLDAEACTTVFRILRPADFYRNGHQEIAAGLVALVDRGVRPDVVLLRDELVRAKRLDAAGGEDALQDLATAFPTAANADHYARIVREMARRRSAIYVAEAAAKRWRSPNGTPFPEDLLATGGDLRDILESVHEAEPEPLLRVVAPPDDWMTSSPPPRRWLLRHTDRDGKACGPGEGDGVLARGIAGILAGEGGSSKTMIALQLAVSCVTGRPFLGRFVIDSDVRWSSARILLALAEEDEGEVHRRIYAIGRAYGLDQGERAAVTGRIRVMPLAGVDTGLLVADASGDVRRSPVADELGGYLAAHAGADGWALIVLDPLARWAGVEIESDNRLATRWVEVLEEVGQKAPGHPTVLVAAHSSKFARRMGDVDARGVTALTDGARWFATISVGEEGLLELMQRKSNYSRPWGRPIAMERGAYGVLAALTEDEQAAYQSAADDGRAQARDDARARQAEADLEAVLAALDAAGGEASSKDALAALAKERGPSRARARDAIEVALARGLIVAIGETRARSLRRAESTPSDATSATSADCRRTSAGGSASSAATGAYVVEAPAAEEAGLFDETSAEDEAAEVEGSANIDESPSDEPSGQEVPRG